MGGQNRLGMKLDSPEGEFLVTQPHDLTLCRLCGDFQTLWQRFPTHQQAMVAGSLKRIWKPLKQILPIVDDRRGFAMHETPSPHHFTTIDITDALMAEADPQQGITSCKTANHLIADTGLLGRAGSRRDADTVGIQGGNLLRGDLIVAVDKRIRTQFSKILDEVVREGIVVIDDKDHDGKKLAHGCRSEFDGSNDTHRLIDGFLKLSGGL